ncbi:hypothetical protein AS850_02925 [Frondihabitans sp. 762G35]|nr:hypothetical protein [Frondihabitans sp. 762G35]ARC56026.1 hypothetical protein AS850_02925 [Frondihabitans sp. 762G35]
MDNRPDYDPDETPRGPWIIILISLIAASTMIIAGTLLAVLV